MPKIISDKFKKIFDIRLISILVGIIYMSSVIYSLQKTIIVKVDEKEISISTFSQNYISALQENNIEIGENDRISVDLNSAIENGKEIFIKKAVEVLVNVDGKQLAIKTSEDNIDKMLKTEGIILGEEDIINPSIETPIEENMKISITRIITEIVEDKEIIAYETETKKSSDYKVGTSKVIQNGENGEKVIRYKVTYKDDEEVSREKLDEELVKEPVNEIIVEGTTDTVKTFLGSELAYTKKLTVKSTAYTVDEDNDGKPDPPYYGRTRTDTIARRDVNGYSTIAVDPRVIPLGTKVYVEGYGLGIAEDTGGAIKGNKIDVYVNNYYEALNWGIKTVDVYILK